jgi:hypothetical protein
MLKTCRVEKTKKVASTRAIEKILIRHDYIPIASNIAADLEVIQKDNDFIFKRRGAKKSDAHPIFRRITFLSLLIGLPIAVYVIGHGLISILLSLLLNIKTSSVIASGISFGLCLILFLSFHLNRSFEDSIKSLPDALNSDRWQKRVAALKIIDKKGLEISSFQAYPKLLASTYIPERYWFIRTLANSRSVATYRDLLNFLNDPHPNVLTMTFYALGQRGNRQAIGEIIEKIETSNNWYSQWYGYRALRSLGWRQTKLN